MGVKKTNTCKMAVLRYTSLLLALCVLCGVCANEEPWQTSDDSMFDYPEVLVQAQGKPAATRGAPLATAASRRTGAASAKLTPSSPGARAPPTRDPRRRQRG